MPEGSRFGRAEAVWSRDWRQVRAAFAGGARLVGRHPWVYLLLFLALVLLKLAWKAVDFSQLAGWRLYLAANVVGFFLAFLRFCVLGLVFAVSADRLGGLKRGLPNDALRRLGRMLPFGVALYILWDVVGGLLGYGLFRLADVFMDAAQSGWALDAALFLGWLPGMMAAAVFGFALVGAAAGDAVSLREARAMWRQAPMPLIYTFLLWYAALQIPLFVTRLLFYADLLPVIDLNWLVWVNRPVFIIFFGAVAAVWYVRLRDRRDAGEDDCPAG